MRVSHFTAAASCLTLARNLGSELPLPHVTRRRYLREVRAKLGFEKRPADILRPTCASYLLAHWQGAGRVVAELGPSAGIVLRHYRELVNKEEAARSWRLAARTRFRSQIRQMSQST